MGSPASIRVNDDLTTSQACIALGPADDELAGRVDVQVCVAAIQADGRLSTLQLDRLKRPLDYLLLNLFVHLLHAGGHHLRAGVASTFLGALGLGGLRVLGGDHNCVDLLGLDTAIGMLHILNRDLRLAIRAQPPALSALAHLRQGLAEPCGHGVGQRHAV